jgi:hypothetical protein
VSERDAVVAEALAGVRVPAPTSRFWERLDVALREADGEAPSTLVPPPDPSEVARELGRAAQRGEVLRLQSNRDRWRVRRNRLRAAGVVVAILSISAAVAWAATSADRGVVPAEPAPGQVDEATDADEAAAVAAVEAFVDALGSGDLASARRLLGVRSEAFAAEELGGVDDVLLAWAEGWGTLPASPDLQAGTVRVGPGEIVVVLWGTSTSEGPGEVLASAVPVVQNQSAGGWLVEPFAFDPAREFRLLGPVEPDAGTDGVHRLTAGDALVVESPDVPQVLFAPVGQEPTAVTPEGRVARWVPPDLGPDPIPVVIAVLDGALFHAVAVLVASA